MPNVITHSGGRCKCYLFTTPNHHSACRTTLVRSSTSNRQADSPPRRGDAEKDQIRNSALSASSALHPGFQESPPRTHSRFPSSPARAQSEPRTQRPNPFKTQRLRASAVYPRTCRLCSDVGLNRHLETLARAARPPLASPDSRRSPSATPCPSLSAAT